MPGHMQRGGSPSAYDRVLATEFGTYAAKLVEADHYGVAVAMKNNIVTENALKGHCGQDEAGARNLRHAHGGAPHGREPRVKGAAR